MFSLTKLAEALLVASVALLVPGSVHAEGESSAERLAREKFRDGRAFLEQGRWLEAVEMFHQSQQLDPAPGTLANLAFCYEQLGNTSGAWIAYKETASAARGIGKSEWATLAEQSAAVLEKSAPRVVILIERPNLDGLGLWLDDIELPPRLWSESPPVTPGQHELRAKAAGRRPWSMPFDVSSERSETIRVPELEPLAVPTVPTLEPKPTPELPESGRSPRGSLDTAAKILALTALVPLGVGVAFGIDALAAHRDALTDCTSSRNCNPTGMHELSRFKFDAIGADAAFALSGAELAGALVLVLLGRQNVRQAWIVPQASHQSLTMAVGATW